MSTGTNSAASSSNGPSTTASGINLNHLSRNQLEKIINMRINAQTCHDVKCKKEKEYFQKIISKMADSFTELISQVEKQRRTLQEVVRLHNKICNEFAIPNKINNNQNEVDFQNLRGIAAMFQDFFAKQAKNVGVAAVKQNPPTMIVNMSEISTVSNERKRKFPVAGNVSASPVTFQTSSMNNNNSALAGKQSSIKTPPFTPQKPFTTPSTSKMTAANNFATPLQHKTVMMSGNTANNNVAMATPPTASASAIIYQGKELSFGGGGSNIANSTPKKPKFTLPKTTKIISNIQPNEIDIIQID